MEWVWEGEGLWIPAFCCFRDGGAAGVGESKEAGTLIESFTCCIVPCLTEEFSGSVCGSEPELRMSAGDSEREDGKLGLGTGLEPGGREVAEVMVDANEWLLPYSCQHACRYRSDDE